MGSYGGGGFHGAGGQGGGTTRVGVCHFGGSGHGGSDGDVFYAAAMGFEVYLGAWGLCSDAGVDSFVASCHRSCGGGGGGIGRAAALDLPVATTFRTGSGGGGGGGSSYGGGGGGGGGALRLVATELLRLGPTARVLSNGGSGSGTTGGGGSGGVIWLGAPDLQASEGALVSARGGNVGQPGAGGLGRVRLSVDPRCVVGGTFQPPLADGCTRSPPEGVPARSYVGTWPD